MKSKIQLSLTALCFVALLTLASGCKSNLAQTLDRTLFTPTAWQTNVVPEHVEQVKQTQNVIVTRTNAAGQVTGTVTNRETVIVNVTVPAHQEVQPVAWKPNETATGTANLVGTFGGPWGALAGTAFTAALGIAAHLRNRKYKDAAISLAQGTQHVLEMLPTEADKIVAVQKAVQDDHGTRALVDGLMKDFVEVKPKV